MQLGTPWGDVSHAEYSLQLALGTQSVCEAVHHPEFEGGSGY